MPPVPAAAANWHVFGPVAEGINNIMTENEALRARIQEMAAANLQLTADLHIAQGQVVTLENDIEILMQNATRRTQEIRALRGNVTTARNVAMASALATLVLLGGTGVNLLYKAGCLVGNGISAAAAAAAGAGAEGIRRITS
jgi:hypothetical protein